MRIMDRQSDYSDRVEEKVANNRERLLAVDGGDVLDIDLFANDDEIANAFSRLLDEPRGDVDLVLDVSCVPKRFFFFMIKLALNERRVETLIVTYTQPGSGGYTYEPLAGDPEDVRAIPGFRPGHDDPEMLVVGLGFEPLGLPQLIGEYRDRQRDIEVLLPFPPGQPYSRRIWKSLQTLGLHNENRFVHRVGAMDAFETCRVIENVGARCDRSTPPALAPYGPKPMSLGMCLYALRRQAPVLYTQPRFYHPDYTIGIGESWGYCLKRGRRPTF